MGQLISTCYVIIEIAGIDNPTIYLRPVSINKFQKVQSFNNVFDAKKWILANSKHDAVKVKKAA